MVGKRIVPVIKKWFFIEPSGQMQGARCLFTNRTLLLFIFTISLINTLEP